MSDLGLRCGRHEAHVFLPNCPACRSLNAEWHALTHRHVDA